MRPILIAECGNNHEGSLDAAMEMLEKAKDAGADMVKFQAGTAEGFARAPEDVPKYRKYELGVNGYLQLYNSGLKLGIPVFFSVWAGDEFDALCYWPPYYKIAARQCNQEFINDYRDHRTQKQTVFISIPHTMNILHDLPRIDDFIPMHCVAEYPARDPLLHRIDHIRYAFQTDKAGWSDHCVGVDIAIMAAKMWKPYAIEKHFTLAHDFGPLRDHAHSATPDEFRRLRDALAD